MRDVQRTASILALVGLLGWGCGNAGSDGAHEADPAPQAREADEADESEARAATATDEPPAAVPTPVTVRVVNDTDRAVTLDRSFGPAQPLGIARLDGPLPPTAELDEQDDERSGGWVSTCECVCDDAPCPECEPPSTVHVELAPGEAYELPWNGRLKRSRVHSDGGLCFEPFAPPPGRYVLTACTTEARCGRAEVTLPASGDLRVRLANAAPAQGCDDLAARALERARAGLLRSLRHVLRERPLERCPERAPCVAPEEVEAALREAREAPCSVFVVPRGRQIEAILLVPVPDGHLGGERFRHWLDPDATQVLRARYEQ
jgi:hypothetical protein